jgi:hypothetical protein
MALIEVKIPKKGISPKIAYIKAQIARGCVFKGPL